MTPPKKKKKKKKKNKREKEERRPYFDAENASKKPILVGYDIAASEVYIL